MSSPSRAFRVVELFEEAVSEFTGAKYGVAVNTGTSAIFLSLQYARTKVHAPIVKCPARTFISVPMAALQAGFQVEFEDIAWSGMYELKPFGIWDAALRFRKGMYRGGLQCLSFQARKILNIGEGGMILTDSKEASEWLKKARYWGRSGPRFSVEEIEELGYQMYLTPEKAARGLHLLEYIKDDSPDQVNSYPDLRECPIFKRAA